MDEECLLCDREDGEPKTYRSDMDGVFKAHPECVGDIEDVDVEKVDEEEIDGDLTRK